MDKMVNRIKRNNASFQKNYKVVEYTVNIKLKQLYVCNINYTNIVTHNRGKNSTQTAVCVAFCLGLSCSASHPLKP